MGDALYYFERIVCGMRFCDQIFYRPSIWEESRQRLWGVHEFLLSKNDAVKIMGLLREALISQNQNHDPHVKLFLEIRENIPQ